MTHRYLRPGWWIRRLAVPAERLMPSPWVMRALVFAARHDGEPELEMLPDLVRRDRWAVDVGAADGVYTWHLARLAVGCVAFEPNPVSAERVRKRVPGADVRAVALSRADGKTRLRIPLTDGVISPGLATVEAANPLGSGNDAIEIDVPMRRLDSLRLPRVGFMKIDVEGHELAVLQGAEVLIKRDRPTLLIEVEDRHRPQARASVINWLGARGYSRPVATSSINLLFTPDGLDQQLILTPDCLTLPSASPIRC